MAPKTGKWFAATPNTDYIFKALTDGTVSKMTANRIPKMTAAQAAGLVGSWIIETGRPGLQNLDVVEQGSGRGRGLSQYTGVRRGPYDQAVAAARAAGKDPNSAQWQLEYFAKEYLNKDLIGWTRVFENAPKSGSPADYAKYYTGSAQQGTGYFRPGVPHWDRRMQAAMEVFKHYTGQATSAPKPTTPAASTQSGTNPLDGILKKLGIKGGPQSFNTDKIQYVAGLIADSKAVKSDVGLAIFASRAPSFDALADYAKKWKTMGASQRSAWNSVGESLGITNQIFQKGTTYQMPKSLSIGSGTSSYKPQASIGPKTTSFDAPDFLQDRGYKASAANQTYRGGLPGLHQIAQAGIANYKDFTNRSAGYGAAAYGRTNSTIGGINSRSYGTSMDLGQSLGIRGGAGSAASAAASGGYTWASTASAGNSWQGSYGYSK